LIMPVMRDNEKSGELIVYVVPDLWMERLPVGCARESGHHKNLLTIL
jgi:hypothetical protein